MAPTTNSSYDPTPVFFYVSSFVGYVRVVLATYSLCIAFRDYKTSALCYSISFAFDFFDGFIARRLGHCANFHSILDSVTDRCSTAGLLVVLSHFYPSYIHAFLFLLVNDVSSHWYHMFASKGHHKTIDGDRNWLLRLYYGVYPFFGYCCIGTELFYISLYVLHFNPTYVIPLIDLPLEQLCIYVCLPACVLKNIVNLCQLTSAAYAIAEDDVKCMKNE